MRATTASNILKDHWDETIPVEPAVIAAKMGVVVESDPFLTPASGGYEPNGSKDGHPLIRFNPTEAVVRQRFTIAHELGHHALGHGPRPRDTTNNFNMSAEPEEREANRFAAELLMPESAVKAMIHVRGITSIEKLASLFGVSKAAMKFRVVNLGYSVE